MEKKSGVIIYAGVIYTGCALYGMGYIIKEKKVLLFRKDLQMTELKEDEKECLKMLFSSLQDSLIQSCIQNYFGRAWVDQKRNPTSGKIVVSDFAFLAGQPDIEILHCGMDGTKQHPQTLVADRTEWFAWIEKEFAGKYKRIERYALKKEGDIFDRDRLEQYVTKIAKDYEIRLIEKEDVAALMQEEWSHDFCCNYKDANDFMQRGIGVVICDEDEIVAGASSYTSYREGIEIEIITRQDYRKKGLAHASGAKLILECLQRGLYPNWDARNMTSVQVAKDLGYTYLAPYTVYEVWE